MRYFTAGESHGPQLTAIIEGIPAGLSLTTENINLELERRQAGYGRGGRMKIEADRVTITSGVRHGETLGSPITLTVVNHDFENWQEIMGIAEAAEKVKSQRKVVNPRPGHADLAGGMKYDFKDLRNVLERSSARETTMRVAVGAVAKRLLSELGVELAHHVVNFGGIEINSTEDLTVEHIRVLAGQNDLSIIDETKMDEIHAFIDEINKTGDSLGGVLEVRATGLPAGLGSYVQYDRKLDAKIAAAVVSINAFKGVEFGLGFAAGSLQGTQVMDEITWQAGQGYGRRSDHLGGFEGGMSNGQDLIIRGVMKPIPTLRKPLMSVNIETHGPYQATRERSDVTAVPAAGVVMENVVATVLAQEICEQFMSDTMTELKEAFENYRNRIRNF